MELRTLGRTDLKLSIIGLGTWAIGGSGYRFAWGHQDDADSIAAIRRALELGVNWIDTAAVYGLGHSEEVVGQAIRPLSEKPSIATKCGRVWNEKGEIAADLSREAVRRGAEESLARLGVDTIDLFQIHWPQPDGDIEEAWETIGDLIDEGKVRCAGVSNFNVEQMARLEAIRPIASSQPPYSMLKRQAEEAILPYCGEKRIGVLPYSPMQKGLLTDKFTREWAESLPDDDHRSKDKMFRDPHLAINLECVEGLRRIACEAGRSVGDLAIAWVLRRSEVASAIVGARRPSQIEETVSAADWTLSSDEIEAVEQVLDRRLRALEAV
ncbi:aldo/keto reductase [Candidatus Sumerlaeota bacterium]|nr:aldo/keto reductase [Candidatus Sumerlaeota bacterium]